MKFEKIIYFKTSFNDEELKYLRKVKREWNEKPKRSVFEIAEGKPAWTSKDDDKRLAKPITVQLREEVEIDSKQLMILLEASWSYSYNHFRLRQKSIPEVVIDLENQMENAMRRS